MAYTIEDLMAFLRSGSKAPPTKSELAVLVAQINELPPDEKKMMLRLLQELAEKGPAKAGQRKMNEAYWAKMQQIETQKRRQERRKREKKWEEFLNRALLIVSEGDDEADEAPVQTEAAAARAALLAHKTTLVRAVELITPDDPDDPDEPEAEYAVVRPTQEDSRERAEILETWDVPDDDRFLTAMKSYENAFYAALQKMRASDKDYPDFKNSSFYRKFRSALDAYIQRISDPNCWPEMGIELTDSADEIRRKWANVPEFSALENTCLDYLDHCQETYEKNREPRRALRLRQAEDVQELLHCLKSGVDEPVEYARYKLAEAAMKGAGTLFRNSRDEKVSEAGRKILEDLNGRDAAKQQKQVFQIYKKKSFRGFTKALNFSELCELRRGDSAEIVNRCHKLQVEWSMEQTKNTPTEQPPAAETDFCVLSR